jgi:hypothetical protein
MIPPADVCEIHFIKHEKDTITMDNIKEIVQVSSIRGNSASTSLYHMLSKVFVPLMRGAEKGLGGRTALNDQLYALRATLHMIERQKGTNLTENKFEPA